MFLFQKKIIEPGPTKVQVSQLSGFRHCVNVFMLMTCYCLKVDPNNDLFKVCFYLVRTANSFFRAVREHGVFLFGDVCTATRTCGHEMNAALLKFTH